MSEVVDHGVRFGRIAVTLPVTDMAKAHDFYTQVLGFTKTFENGNPVGFMILKRDQGELHLTLHPQHQPSSFNAAHLLVDDVDTLYATCVQHGARVIKGLKNQDYGLRAFVFADPDGNRIDVGQLV
jgi:catechol 2,3-dioxygenase-like lactoylglutathione lyase family enzyme